MAARRKGVEQSSRSDPIEEGGVYPWVVVLLLMALYAAGYIDRTILSLLVIPIERDLGISDTQYGLLAGFAFVIMYSVAMIPAGWLADRWSRSGVISIGAVVWSLMTASCGLANNFLQLFGLRVGLGVGEATLNPASYSLISDYFRSERLSRAMSIYALGSSVGTGLALVLGGTLVQMATDAGPAHVPLIGMVRPWQSVFILVGLPGLLLALLATLIVREPVRSEVAQGAVADAPNLRTVVAYLWQRRASYAPIFAGVGLTALYGYAANAWYPTFLMRVHGFSAVQAGLILGSSTVVLGISGAIAAGVISDWLTARGRQDAQLIVGVWYGIGLILCGALGCIVPSRTLSLILIAASTFFIKTTTGIMAGALQVITPNRMRGRVSGIYLFVVGLIAEGLGPLSVALCTDYLFVDPKAVGYSLGLVGAVAISGGIISFQLGRSSLKGLTSKPVETA